MNARTVPVYNETDFARAVDQLGKLKAEIAALQDEEKQLKALLAASDQALYEAKHQGRNRVVLA